MVQERDREMLKFRERESNMGIANKQARRERRNDACS